MFISILPGMLFRLRVVGLDEPMVGRALPTCVNAELVFAPRFLRGCVRRALFKSWVKSRDSGCSTKK